MANVVIFGIKDTAQLAKYYLDHDSEHNVVAFTVSRKYLETDTFEDLPVVAFEELEQHYPPSGFHFFAPMTASAMNRNRESIYLQGKAKGYTYISYISSRATVFTDKIGENCFILENNTLQPFVSIGNNCVLWSGNIINHHATIKNHVFFTSHVVLSGHCEVNDYCFFGVNSAIRDASMLAEGTLVAMGANVIKDTEAWGSYMGNPATKHSKPSYELYK